MDYSYPSHSKQGASLIELLGFLLFLSLIAGISIPRLSQFITTSQLRSYSRAIEHTVNRLILLSQQREIDINITIRPLLLEAHPEIDKNTTLSAVHLSPPFHFETQGQAIIQLHPQGVTSPLSFSLTNGDDTCFFIISLRGRLRTQCFE